jgi:hypothetical protein
VTLFNPPNATYALIFNLFINCIFSTQLSWLSAESDEDGLASGILLAKYATSKSLCRIDISVKSLAIRI